MDYVLKVTSSGSRIDINLDTLNIHPKAMYVALNPDETRKLSGFDVTNFVSPLQNLPAGVEHLAQIADNPNVYMPWLFNGKYLSVDLPSGEYAYFVIVTSKFDEQAL